MSVRAGRSTCPATGAVAGIPRARTSRSQLQDVLSTLPPRCVLLGWSLGGQFAMRDRARRAAARGGPGAVRHDAALRASTADWDARPRRRRRSTLFRETLDARLAADARRFHLAAAARQPPCRGDAALIHEALSTPWRAEPRGARGRARDARDERPATRTPRGITHPALRGCRTERPGHAARRGAQWLAAQLPRARYLEIERAGPRAVPLARGGLRRTAARVPRRRRRQPGMSTDPAKRRFAPRSACRGAQLRCGESAATMRRPGCRRRCARSCCRASTALRRRRRPTSSTSAAAPARRRCC